MKRVTWLILSFIFLAFFGVMSYPVGVNAAEGDAKSEGEKIKYSEKDDIYAIATRLKDENLRMIDLLYTAFINSGTDKAKTEADLKGVKEAYAKALLQYQRRDYRKAASMFRANEVDLFDKMIAVMKIYHAQCTQMMEGANQLYVQYKTELIELKKKDKYSIRKKGDEKPDDKDKDKKPEDKKEDSKDAGKKPVMKPFLPEVKMAYLEKHLNDARISLAQSEGIINPRYKDCYNLPDDDKNREECMNPFSAVEKEKTKNNINELVKTIPLFRACKQSLFTVYTLFEVKSDHSKESEEIVLDEKYNPILENKAQVKDVLKNYRKHMLDCKDLLSE